MKLNDTLTQKEVDRILQLNEKISFDVNCELNCRTCRLQLLEYMKEYLEIHNYRVIKK